MSDSTFKRPLFTNFGPANEKRISSNINDEDADEEQMHTIY